MALPKYIGIFLTPQSRRALLREYPPVHPIVHTDHITLVYEPTEADLAKIDLGSFVKLRAKGYYVDDKAQALTVELPPELARLAKRDPHITISTTPDTQAVYSNKLIRGKGERAGQQYTGIVDSQNRQHKVLTRRFPMASRVAMRYEGRTTQQYDRFKAVLDDFEKSFRDISHWRVRKPLTDELARTVAQKASAVVKMMDLKFENEAQARKLKKSLRKWTSFRKMLEKISNATALGNLETPADAMATVIKGFATKSKDAWDKYVEGSRFVLSVLAAVDTESEGILDVGGYTVRLLSTPQWDWNKDAAAKLTAIVTQTEGLLKSKGLGKAIGGKMLAWASRSIPLSGSGSRNTMASYIPTMDIIRLAVGGDVKTTVKTLIHELGHRWYFRVMGSQGRKEWLKFFGDNVGEPNLNGIMAEWERYAAKNPLGNWLGHFAGHLQKKDPDQYMWLMMAADTIKLHEEFDLMTGSPKRKKTNIPGIEQVKANLGKIKTFLHPVTAYSATNEAELFAETFAYAVTHGPRRLPPIVRDAFSRAVPQARIASGPDLSGSPQSRVAARYLIARDYFEVGDPILYGKYKNKKGRIVAWGTDHKGNPTVEIEPIPKGRKKNKVFGLFKIWKNPPPAIAEQMAEEAQAKLGSLQWAQGYFQRHPKLRGYARIQVVEKATGASSSHGEARQHGNEIWLFPKFQKLDSKTQDWVFTHEIGHYVLSKFGLASFIKLASDQGLDLWDTSSLPYGQHNMDEAFADCFAAYFLNPGELKSRYPAWHGLVSAVVSKVRTADLAPPLGYPGGPCHVVKRIDDKVRNQRTEDKLIDLVESGRALSNPDAAKVYSVETEQGPWKFKRMNLTVHAQYRMDLRGITVPELRLAVNGFFRAYNKAKSRKKDLSAQDEAKRWEMAMMRREKINWTDPKLGLTVVFTADAQRNVLDVITTYWRGQSDPPAPGACRIARAHERRSLRS